MKSVHLSTVKCPCTMLIALPPASVLTSSLSSPGPDSSSSVSRFWKTCYSSSTALPGRPTALRLAAMTSPQVVKSKEKPAELGGRSGPPGSPGSPRGRHRRSTHLSVAPGWPPCHHPEAADSQARSHREEVPGLCAGATSNLSLKPAVEAILPEGTLY